MSQAAHRRRNVVWVSLVIGLVASLFGPMPAGAEDKATKHYPKQGGDEPCVEFTANNLGTAHDGNQEFGDYYQPEEVDKVVAQLSNRPTVTTSVIGFTNRGRPIHSVRLGEGDRVVFVQAGIHGNELTGTTAAINLLKELSRNHQEAREVREAITLVVIPLFNADGAHWYQRANSQTWDETVEMFPQLAGRPRAFYHSLPGPAFWSNPRVDGYDLNRDFNPDFNYVVQPAHVPGSSGTRGLYLTPEARASRDLYASLEQEFGLVDVFVDLHNQAPCSLFDHDGDSSTPRRYSPMSISAQFLSNPANHGAGTTYPNFDYDASRRANVAAWEGTQEAGSPYADITRYPQNLNLAGSANAAYQLRGSASVLMEAGRQRHFNPEWRLEFIAEVHQLAVRGIIDSLVDGSFYEIDPNRYFNIPIRS